MRRPVSYFAVIALMLGVAQAACASDAAPQIVVVVAPIASYVGALTQNVAPAQSLLQPGQDPHHFSLTPSQGRMIDHADILIIPDLSMSPAVAGLVASHPKLHVIELSKLNGAAPLPYADDNPWLAAVKKAGNDKDDDAPDAPAQGPAPAQDPGYKKLSNFMGNVHAKKTAAPTTDPHFWLDPERMAAIALPLADAIGAVFPAHRATLETNAKAESQHLRHDILPEMRALLTPHHDPHPVNNKPEIPFITYHAAYQYFLARFGVAHGGEITTRPEDYMGAKTLDSLLATAKTAHVRCVIGEADTTLVRRIAGLAGAKVVVVSPEQNISQNEAPPLSWLQTDYDRLLYKTAKSFSDCL